MIESDGGCRVHSRWSRQAVPLRYYPKSLYLQIPARIFHPYLDLNMLCANLVIPLICIVVIFTGIRNLVNYKKQFNGLMLKWMWNELHVFYELFYIYFLSISCEIFIIICNSYIIEQNGFGMSFAYNEAMAGSPDTSGMP